MWFGVKRTGDFGLASKSPPEQTPAILWFLSNCLERNSPSQGRNNAPLCLLTQGPARCGARRTCSFVPNKRTKNWHRNQWFLCTSFVAFKSCVLLQFGALRLSICSRLRIRSAAAAVGYGERISPQLHQRLGKFAEGLLPPLVRGNKRSAAGGR